MCLPGERPTSTETSAPTSRAPFGWQHAHLSQHGIPPQNRSKPHQHSPSQTFRPPTKSAYHGLHQKRQNNRRQLRCLLNALTAVEKQQSPKGECIIMYHHSSQRTRQSTLERFKLELVTGTCTRGLQDVFESGLVSPVGSNG